MARTSPAGSATITVEEAAAILGIARNTAYRAAQSGQLAAGVPVLRIRGTLRVPRGLCEKFARGELSEAS